MPEVSVVIVCMNRPDILFPCLDSIREGNASAVLETFVVAYCFTAENLALLKERYPWVTVVPSNEVRGFSENNNLALKQAGGRFCFIVNDDTIVPPGTIQALVDDLGRLPSEAAAVSPKIVFPSGRVQTSGRAPWSRWRYARHYLHMVDETKPTKWSMKEGLFRTYTLNGACFLIRTDIFRELGFFDERYFFTPEDIAFGHALNDAGFTVWADSDISITHYAGGSVSAMERAIKPARVRGSMIFYGEPFLLKCFIWCVEALRSLKYIGKPNSARNVMRTVFSKQTPKEIFIRFRP